MKATDSSGSMFHICDFCGASSKGAVSIFVSALDENVAICKKCVDAAPSVVGKIITRLGATPRKDEGNG